VSKFVLKPARLLQTRLVVSKNEPEIEVDFKGLQKLLLPPNSPPFEKAKVLNLHHGMFIGHSQSAKRPGQKVIFTLFNIDRSGNIEFVLKKDPSFETRLLKAYFVEKAEYDAKISESSKAQAKVA
jgi:hypothetical protein